MTREQLHSTQGFHPPSLLAAALHLRTAMSRKRGGTDPTAIINNEGRINGYLDAIDDLIAAASPKPPEAAKKEYQPYKDPNQTQPVENPNKP
jgi:hypothetical protein